MTLTPKHISFERLADLAEGRLHNDEREHTTAHLGACAPCAAQLAQLERTIALMRTDDTPDAPESVVTNTIKMFRARFPKYEAPSQWRRVMAALSFDSAQLAPAFGLRSGQAAEAQQLLFSAGERDIDLRVAAGTDGWTISGQVLGECEGGQVEIETIEGATTRARAELNELCEFALPPVPAGSYKLCLRFGDVEVEVPELQLR